MRYVILSTLFLVLTICSQEATGQRRNKYRKLKSKERALSHYTGGSVGGRFRPYSFISANLNALNYYGDLAPVNRAASTDVSFTRPGFGVNIGYKLAARTSFRMGFNYGRIKGDDFTSEPENPESGARYVRNLSFRNDIKEFHIGFEFYLFPNYGGPNVRPPFNIYLLIGGAVFHHEPKGLVPEFDYTIGGPNSTAEVPQGGTWVKLRPLGTEGQYLDDSNVDKYLPIQFSVPLALGATLRLPGPFEVGLELGYRYLFTDYLDDVSGSYVTFDRFDDPLTRIMSDRSAEPIAAWDGSNRNIAVVNQSINGQTFYSGGGPYAIGGGLADGAIRGNPDDNDMFFVTTLKLTMILGQTNKSAKFR